MASEVAKRLRDRRLNVWNEAKGLADSAAEENRAFSAEEQGKWDALNEEIDKLDVRIKSVLETEQRAKDADSAYDALTGKPVDVNKRGEPPRRWPRCGRSSVASRVPPVTSTCGPTPR